MINLRDYQLEAIETLRSNIRSGFKNQILSASTGAGKTVCAAYLLKECHEKYKRAVFIADRIALIDQTSATLDQYGIPHGVIQGDHWRFRPYERIQIASAQTLARREWPDADLIIVDEAHTISQTVIDRIKGREVITIGLTATPFTKGLGKYYDTVASVTTTNNLIRDNFLTPYRIFAASEPDMAGAKVVAGEWSDNEAADRSMPIVGDCVAEYMKHGEGKKFIAFGCNVAHCEELQRQFMAAGVMSELYVYTTPDSARADMVKEFRKPDSYIRGLISVSALAKGFDVSDVEVIIMARPLRKSLSEHIQMLGRGLRIHPGKTQCTILDHSGNCERFWPEMSQFFEEGAPALDDGKPKPKAKVKPKFDAAPQKCPKCAAVHERAPNCPQCGHVYSRSSSVRHIDGKLAEFHGKATVTKEDKQQIYSELLGLARSRGYADGWIAHKYRDKFSVWPRGMQEIAVNPSQKTINWVKSQMIRYSKGQKREAANAV